MNTIELKPDECVAVKDHTNRCVLFTYSELQQLAMPIMPSRKHRTSPGIKFSHHVALAMRALETGKWPTGGRTDYTRVLRSLLSAFDQLGPAERLRITPKAVAALTKQSKHFASLTGIIARLQKEAKNEKTRAK